MMSSVQSHSDTLQVPGARLYYETRGTASGQTLLLIPGGPTDARIFDGLANALADHYRVVTFDPRGLSRSPQDSEGDVSVALYADDAARLLHAVTAEPAFVFGNSGGAMVGLDLAARYPDQVRGVVAHEPPCVELLPDCEQQRAQVNAVHQTYVEQGVLAAMQRFMVGAGLTPPPSSAPPRAPDPSMLRNMEFFLAHMLVPNSTFVPDVARLRTGKPRVVVAVGAASHGQLAYRTSVALAERLGTQPVELPSDHGGFIGQPAAFAESLRQLLAS
jgi:pimeloyl-ACP methyl ester carboxylesterase